MSISAIPELIQRRQSAASINTGASAVPIDLQESRNGIVHIFQIVKWTKIIERQP
jgi:hypothetical protein